MENQPVSTSTMLLLGWILRWSMFSYISYCAELLKIFTAGNVLLLLIKK